MLVMVGYVTIDPAGPERLAKVLERYSPRVIGLEISPDESAEEEISEMVTEAVKILLNKTMAAYTRSSRGAARKMMQRIISNIGYGEQVVRQYASRSGAEVVPLENTIERYNFVRSMHRRARSLVAVKEHLPGTEFDPRRFRESIDSTYYNEQVIARTLMLEPPVVRRSRAMAKRIVSSGCDLTVTGFAHIVNFPGTVYHELRSDEPERFPLPRADEL